MTNDQAERKRRTQQHRLTEKPRYRLNSALSMEENLKRAADQGLQRETVLQKTLKYKPTIWPVPNRLNIDIASLERFVAESVEKASIRETMKTLSCTSTRTDTKIELEEEFEEDFKIYPGTDSPNIKNPGLVLGDSQLDELNKAGLYHKKLVENCPWKINSTMIDFFTPKIAISRARAGSQRTSITDFSFPTSSAPPSLDLIEDRPTTKYRKKKLTSPRFMPFYKRKTSL